MDIAPRLNLEVLSTALIILSGRFLKLKGAEDKEKSYRRIIFQALAHKRVNEVENKMPRTKSEDEDLIAVLDYLSDQRWNLLPRHRCHLLVTSHLHTRRDWTAHHSSGCLIFIAFVNDTQSFLSAQNPDNRTIYCYYT